MDVALPCNSIPAAPVKTFCHHIMPSGRRCRSIRCNQSHYCYFHSGELNRKYDRIDGMHANYRLNILPVIEDRASIQIALNEIIRCYISDSIDSRKAGILLYGMNIALSNLRNDPAPVIAEEDAVASYQNIPEHDPSPAWTKKKPPPTQPNKKSAWTNGAAPTQPPLQATQQIRHISRNPRIANPSKSQNTQKKPTPPRSNRP